MSRNTGPCLCGDTECPSCGPLQGQGGLSRAAGESCPDCDGTGQGPCVGCGDGAIECCCDDPEHPDCETCDGTGVNPPEPDAEGNVADNLRTHDDEDV